MYCLPPLYDVQCTMHCPFGPSIAVFYMEAKRKITRFEDLIVKELEKIGVLRSQKAGKEKLYLNVRLYELLAS